MRPRRIYVPLTHEQVRDLAAERRLAAPLQGYAAGSPGRVTVVVESRPSPEAVHLTCQAVRPGRVRTWHRLSVTR